MRETGIHFKRWECEGRSTLCITEHIISLFIYLFIIFVQVAPVVPHMIDSVMAAIKEEGTPDLHLLACLLAYPDAEEVAHTPDPVHAQDLGPAQGPYPPVFAVAAQDLGHVHGQDHGLVQMSVEGELLEGEGDRPQRGR